MFAFRVAKDTPAPAASARNLSVADVMTTHVYTCGVDDTVEQAARVMAEHACGAVPVLTKFQVSIFWLAVSAPVPPVNPT